MTAEEEFINYTDSYKKCGEKAELKIKHTFRVQRLCNDLAINLGLNKEEIELAKLCGLLHDIGRFEQIKRFNSYDDLRTLDHGDLGYQILKENNFINKFTKKNKNTVLMAVKYHNKYKVPNTLSKMNKLYTNITRDADKIDILYLFTKKILVSHPGDTSMSNKIFNSLINKRPIRRNDLTTKADDISVRFGFLFDLNFKESYKIIKENGYIDKMINNQIAETNNKELIKQLKEIQKVLNNYIEEMISC